MKRIAATATALALALSLAACGGGDEEADPIPARQAEAMLNLLALIEDQTARGTCGGARDKVDRLARRVENLPEGVDSDVRSSLEEGVAHLSGLVDDECERNREQREDETDTSTETVPTETVPELPTETTTEPDTTDTDTTEPDTTEPDTTEPDTTEPDTTEPIDPGNGNGGVPGLERGGGRDQP